MIITESEFKQQKIKVINENFDIPQEIINIYNQNIKKVLSFHVNVTVAYNNIERKVQVDGNIKSILLIEDSRTLQCFESEINVPWIERYYFTNKKNIDENFINIEKFDIISYAWDEVIINIPGNLTLSDANIISNDPSWQVMSEQEADNITNNTSQINWEDLNHAQQKKEDK